MKHPHTLFGLTIASKLSFLMLTFAYCVCAQLPEGAGKEEVERICTQCHELQRSTSLHQDHDGWAGTVSKMISLGAQGTNKEFLLAVDYLARSYPGEPLPKVDVNKARAIEFESLLTIRKSQSAQIIAYRGKNGPFQSIEDTRIAWFFIR